jgi:hypothetical protein
MTDIVAAESMDTQQEIFLQQLRQTILGQKQFPFKPKRLEASPELTHGWLLPALLETDDYTWQRWAYWVACMEKGTLVDEPIPQIRWIQDGHCSPNPARKMLEACLDAIPLHGTWQSWGGWEYFNYFMGWLLYGFGHSGQPELPPEPSGCEGCSDRLYQVFCLEALLAWPYDYFGNILAENRHGRGLGFFPTPLNVCELMVKVLFTGDKDCQTKTVCDPCVGTGRFLLVASNFSLRLYGQDINQTVIQACLVNGYLYAPWLVKPFPFLDRDLTDPAHSAAFSEELVKVGASRPDVAEYLADTAHDGKNQWRFEPIKKRRRVKQEESVKFEDVFRVQEEVCVGGE